MITGKESAFIGICLEGFFFGKISFLCFFLTCTLTKHLLPGQDSIQEYSCCIYNAHRTIPGRQQSPFSMLFFFSTFYLLLPLSVIHYLSYLEYVTILSVKISFFYRLCSRVSRHFRLNFKFFLSRNYFKFRLSNS